MLFNYLKIALRGMLRNRNTSIINVLGLAIGMATCLLILAYASFEFSYDRFHSKSDQIFRVLTIDEALGITNSLVGITMPVLGEAMEQEIPEVTQAVRIARAGRNLLTYQEKEKSLYSENTYYTFSDFFEVFDFPLVSGEKNSILDRPNTVVISESMATRMFEQEDPVGKVIRMNNDPESEVEVVGVMKDLPANSHFQTECLISLVPTESDSNTARFLQTWQQISMITYAVLEDPAQEQVVEEKMETLIRSHDVGPNFSVTLQALGDAHLKSGNILFDRYNQNKGDANYIYTLLMVALFVMLIAAFNFMNLSTARSSKRAKEVGMRKVLGALRGQLILQFIGESMLLCLVAWGISLEMVHLGGGLLNLPLEGSVLAYIFSKPNWIVLMIAAVLGLGILAGMYPAFVLSGFRPVKVLKGAFSASNNGIWLRRVLVVTQFTASIAMIIGTLIVYRQLDYIRNSDKGFDAEQIVTLRLNAQNLRENYERLENALRQNPDILEVAAVSSMPGDGFGRSRVRPEGSNDDEPWIVSVMSIDDHYLDLMGMELAEGRNYQEALSTDPQEAMLVNEAFVRANGWESGIGKTLRQGPNSPERRIVGVVKDFHFTSLRHQIEPLMLFFRPQSNGTVALKLKAENINQSLRFVEETWAEINPEHPFEYRFFDEDFAQQYRSEEDFGRLAISFTFLAIFIACLGLLGLSAFTAEQRTREIGIRKILGANASQLVILLSKEFTWLVLIAVIVAGPIAFFLMDDWLQDFAYRIDIQGWEFLLAGIAALLVAWLTNAVHAVRTALGNPTEALRYE